MEKYSNPHHTPSNSTERTNRTFDPDDLNTLELQNTINKTPDIELFDILNEPIPKQASKPEVKPKPAQVVHPNKQTPPPPPPINSAQVQRPVYSTDEAKKQSFSQKTTINFASFDVPPQANQSWQGNQPKVKSPESAKQAQVVWWILGIIFWIVIMRGCL